MNTSLKFKLFASLLVLALTTFVIAVPVARADGALNWTGQGTANGALNTPLCGDSANYGGAQLPTGADANHYLLWIFTVGNGNTITSATLTTNGGTTTWSTDPSTTSTGNQIKFITKAYDLSTLTASVSYVGNLGSGNANLVISHGCTGTTKLDSSTVTTIHDANHGNVGGSTHVALGSVVHDSAAVSGSGATPTGSVSFTFFNTIDCSGSGTLAGTVNLVNGVADPSVSEGPLAAGSYSFKATYSGDSNYNGSTGACEPLTVDKAQLTISTQIHNASHGNVGGDTHVALGSVVHDTASVGGAVTGFAIGEINFTLNGVAVANADPAETGFTASTVDSAGLAAGSYIYKASVAENSNYFGATSADEPLTVDKAQLTIVTQIHDASHGNVGGDTHVALGSVVHDTASVGGAVTGFAIGEINFTLNGVAVANADPAETGFTASTVNSAPLAAGSYIYKATVAENSNYFGATSADEPLTVDKAQLTIVTQIHDASHGNVGGDTHVALGSVVHDTASVGGAVTGFAVGAVSFTLNGASVANDPSADGTATARSVDSAALAAGSYTYKASVADNDNYIGATSADEPLTVDKAQLTIVTQIHDASHGNVGGDTHVALGSVVHDTASVGGAVTGFAIGAVSFTLNGASVANDPSADGTATARSVDSAALAAGSYTYKATVAGNDNYIGATSADEPLTVNKAHLTISTQIHNASHVDITNQIVAPSSVVHDTASVGGAVTGFAIGAVSFTLNGNAVVNANPAETGFTASTVNSAPLAAGSYIYKASVAGNDNYVGDTSADEPLSVPQLGLTAGFWGNTNGVARINAAGGYATNAIAIGRGSNIDTQAESLKVLPSTQNACGKGTPQIFTVGGSTGTTNCTLATGININTLNNAAAQTLALGYNIKLVSGYSGQTINGLVCGGYVAGTGLTGTNTVNDAFARAVTLIDGSASGGTTTQAQLAAINSLFGSCLNREGF
ncbi:MAG: Ig-like domain-containing protein [Caldilineaceae bacterium]